MATTIKLKNSVTTTNAPTSLVQGEVAINITDKKVWVGNAATTPVLLLGSGADGTFTNLTVSGVASFADGTVSLPSITNIGDTNTGIFFPAADTIAFTEGGVESMRIDSSGNLGLGTTSPSFRLDVQGSSGVGIRLLETSTGNNNRLVISQSGTSTIYNSTYASGSANHVFQIADTERMRIDSSGNVGIGTSSPASKFHVSTNTESNTPVARFQNYNLGDLFVATFKNAGSDSNARLAGIEFTGDADAKFGGIGGRQGGILSLFSATGGTLTERMRIDSSGNVGIGTTTPNSPLEIKNSTAGQVLTLTSVANNIYGFATDGTISVYTGGVLNTIGGFAGTSSAHPYIIRTNNTEAMRIDSSGNLLVGTTSRINTEKCIVQQSGDNNAMFVYGTSTTQTADVFQIRCASTTTNSSYKLLVANNGSGTRFQVFDSGNVQNTNNSYGAISDAKLKENIVDATPKLDDLMKVKVRHYNLIGDENKQIGVVAQELESVFAGLVEESIDTDREGNDLGTTTKAVKYSVFVPMLIKAIQELKAEVDSLKQQLGK